MAQLSEEQILQSLRASMAPITQINSYFKFLLYGNSGTGKTVLAMRILQSITPADTQILYVDYREGFEVLANPEWQALTNRVVRIPFKSLFQLEQIGKAIKNKAPGFDNIGAVIFDEITSMSEEDLATVVKKAAEKDSDVDPDVAAWPSYNAEKVRMIRATNILNNMGCHIAYLGHMRVDYENKIPKTDVNLIPALSGAFKRDLSLVGYLTAAVKAGSSPLNEPTYTRIVQVHPTRIQAKTRITNLPAQVSDAGLLKAVVEYVKELTKGEMPDFTMQITETTVDPFPEIIEVD